MVVWSVAVWRLRIGECDGGDIEMATEIKSGVIEGEAAKMHPEVKLVARPQLSRNDYA